MPGSAQAIGIVRGGDLIAGVLYYQYSCANIWAAVAAEPKSRWLNRTVLWALFDYPFRQLGVRRMTIAIDEDNLVSRRFCEGLGFEPETRLKAASPGGDLLIYRMFADRCPWLTRSRTGGNEQRRKGTPSPRLRGAGAPAGATQH
jgi:RimJ/RimL family protein N-acetyltransferase